MAQSFADILGEEMNRKAESQSPAPSASWQPASDLLGFFNWIPLKESRPAPKRDAPVQPEVPPPAPSPLRKMNSVQQFAFDQLIRLGANELTPRATDRDIKKAYRRLAMHLHPDMNREAAPDVLQRKTEAFHLLRQAYEVLREEPQKT